MFILYSFRKFGRKTLVNLLLFGKPKFPSIIMVPVLADCSNRIFACFVYSLFHFMRQITAGPGHNIMNIGKVLETLIEPVSYL